MERTQEERNPGGDRERRDSGQAVPRVPLRTVRSILRQLRDLDLHIRGFQVDGRRPIRLEGCLAPDAPIEEGLTYRLRLADGREARLDVTGLPGALELHLRGLEPSSPPRRIQLHSDGDGRAIAPSLLARLHPDLCDPRQVEHFLRRLVRGAFAPHRAA